jgi:L-aminopeptidase/D-esterase-like protein
MAHLIASSGGAPAEQIAALAARDAELNPLNTTIAVVATDAALSPAGCNRFAVAAQDGLAHTIRPAHTPLDGDTVFALATGRVEVAPDPDTPAAMSPETKLVATPAPPGRLSGAGGAGRGARRPVAGNDLPPRHVRRAAATRR